MHCGTTIKPPAVAASSSLNPTHISRKASVQSRQASEQDVQVTPNLRNEYSDSVLSLQSLRGLQKARSCELPSVSLHLAPAFCFGNQTPRKRASAGGFVGWARASRATDDVQAYVNGPPACSAQRSARTDDIQLEKSLEK